MFPGMPLLETSLQAITASPIVPNGLDLDKTAALTEEHVRKLSLDMHGSGVEVMIKKNNQRLAKKEEEKKSKRKAEHDKSAALAALPACAKSGAKKKKVRAKRKICPDLIDALTIQTHDCIN